MTDQTSTRAPELTLRDVLDAVPRQGAEIEVIAEKLGQGVTTAAVRSVLDRLLIGDLVFMRTPFRQAAQWVPTARARRMKADGSDALATWISSRLASASALSGGGAR